MIPHELVRPIALAAVPGLLLVLLAYLLGGTSAAFLVGLLLLPVTWFALGFVGLVSAASVVMLALAGLVLAESILERQGEDIKLLRKADADVRQARRVATMGTEEREDNLRERIRRQQEELAKMSRRVVRLERGTRELRSDLSESRRRVRALRRAKARAPQRAKETAPGRGRAKPGRDQSSGGEGQ